MGCMDKFKTKFRAALRQVQARYKAARIEVDGYGMRLHNSPPPVTKRLVMLPPQSLTPVHKPLGRITLSTVTWQPQSRSLGSRDSAKTTVTWQHIPIVSPIAFPVVAGPFLWIGQKGMRSAPKGARNDFV